VTETTFAAAETKFAEVRGLNLAYIDEGQGPAVLFLHGYPFNKSMWNEQIAAITGAGFRAIAPDLRGFGETKWTDEIATMEEMARDAAALLDQLQIEQAIVCGLSMGGYVAFDFVHLFASRVKGLVLAGTRAPADTEDEKAGRQQQAETMLRAGMVPISIATLPKLLAAKTRSERPDIVKRVRNMITNSDPKSAAAAQRGMAARRDYSAELSSINVPTLIIVGREDSIRPVSDAELMRERIPHSRLEIVEDAAHITNLEQPEVFNRVLLDFLRLIH
jgi:3-oxoadipate enol-lactonase